MYCGEIYFFKIDMPLSSNLFASTLPVYKMLPLYDQKLGKIPRH